MVISDLHCGCQVGLCPPRIQLDSGGWYEQGPTQKAIWSVWGEFWKWVEVASRGEPFSVLVNGDALDGSHHKSKTQITQNFADQENIAYERLAPVREKAQAMYFIRGTEAHVGQCAENEERLARRLDCVTNEIGRYSSYERWIRVGHGLVHATHHIGTTSSMAYLSSAPMREYTNMLTSAGRWGNEPPDIVVRSHRHTNIEVKVPTARVYGIVTTTPCWQGPTPFVYKVVRTEEPNWGGILIRCGDEELYTRSFVKIPERGPVHDLLGGIHESK